MDKSRIIAKVRKKLSKTYKPMPLKEVIKLKKGDKFRVYYAKDDNPEYLRFNYELQKVEEVSGPDKSGEITVLAGEDWFINPKWDNMNGNSADQGSRGMAKFFYP